MEPWGKKKLKFHDGLQSYQLTSASRSAHHGRSAGTSWLETLKAIVDFQNLILYPVVFTILEAWKLKVGRTHFLKVSVLGLTWCTMLFNFENCVISAQNRFNLKLSNLDIFEIFDTADPRWLSGLSNDVSITFQFCLSTELYQMGAKNEFFCKAL